MRPCHNNDECSQRCFKAHPEEKLILATCVNVMDFEYSFCFCFTEDEKIRYRQRALSRQCVNDHACFLRCLRLHKLKWRMIANCVKDKLGFHWHVVCMYASILFGVLEYSWICNKELCFLFSSEKRPSLNNHNIHNKLIVVWVFPYEMLWRIIHYSLNTLMKYFPILHKW